METNNIQFIPIEQEETSSSSFSLSLLVYKCLSKWYWFAMSLLVCLGIASVYIMKTRPMYKSSATILIKEASARRVATSDIESMINFSGSGSMSSKVVNEVIAFKSPALMMNVVERLGLTTEYSVRGPLRTNIIYGSQVPVDVRFIDVPANVTSSFFVTPKEDGRYLISKLVYNAGKKKVKVAGETVACFGDTVQTEIGKISVTQNSLFYQKVPFGAKQPKWKKPVIVSHRTVGSVTGELLGAFKAEQEDVKGKSDVLNISLVCPSPQRANDVLNMMITVYNENWVEDKNKMAISTSLFIADRLSSLEKELGAVDKDISNYKKENLLPDPQLMSNEALYQNREAVKLLQVIDNQLYLFRYLRTFLLNNPGTNTIIPLGTSTSIGEIASQISEYNRTLLKRDNLAANSSENNPIVMDMTNGLKAVRAAIESAIENQVDALEKQQNELRSCQVDNMDRLADSPTQVQYLTNVGRQQKVKETLYLYLLQKREENELSQAFTAYNTRIITPPMGASAPVSPKKKMILLAAFAIALMIPLIIVYIMLVADTKLRKRSDLENLSIPFLGEIPQYAETGKGLLSRFFRDKDVSGLIVKAGERNIINEAFRVLRTNFEFVTRGTKCPVLIVTSYQPGSGKTFLSQNLANTLAIKDKKVLVIDGDMRHASLSELVNSPKAGLSSYLVGESDDYHKYIVPVKDTNCLDVFPVGKIPPNPSELIASERLRVLINSLRNEYDYVFIDCPPVDIVSDTQVIHDLADKTIFVVRAGLLEKAMIPSLEKLSADGKFNELCLVLNGTSSQANYYGRNNGYYGNSYYGY